MKVINAKDWVTYSGVTIQSIENTESAGPALFNPEERGKGWLSVEPCLGAGDLCCGWVWSAGPVVIDCALDSINRVGVYFRMLDPMDAERRTVAYLEAFRRGGSADVVCLFDLEAILEETERLAPVAGMPTNAEFECGTVPAANGMEFESGNSLRFPFEIQNAKRGARLVLHASIEGYMDFRRISGR